MFTIMLVIFRQGGGDLSTFASYALSAMKVLSLVLSVVDGSGGSGPSNTERIDVGPPAPPTVSSKMTLNGFLFGSRNELFCFPIERN
jgi:hypothetical protein